VLSKLALNCDALNKVLEGREIPKEEAYEIFNISSMSLQRYLRLQKSYEIKIMEM